MSKDIYQDFVTCTGHLNAVDSIQNMPFAPNQTSFPVHVLYVLCCEHINPQTIGYSSPGVSYCSTVVSLKNKRPRGFDDLFIVVCNVIEKICVLIFAYQSCIYNTLILNLQVIPKLT